MLTDLMPLDVMVELGLERFEDSSLISRSSEIINSSPGPGLAFQPLPDTECSKDHQLLWHT